MSERWSVAGTLHETRVAGARRRVFRVRLSSKRAVIGGAHRGHAYDIHADRPALNDLVTAWCLAARSPHSLIWLPLRGNVPPAGHFFDTPDRSMDLVLVRSSVRFPVHEWKRLRSALGAGRPTTARVPSHEFPAAEDSRHPGFDPYFYKSPNDNLGFSEAADTVFITGTRTAFDQAGTELADLAATAPADAVRHPKYHFCAEIDPAYWNWQSGLHRRRLIANSLHVQYESDWGGKHLIR